MEGRPREPEGREGTESDTRGRETGRRRPTGG